MTRASGQRRDSLRLGLVQMCSSDQHAVNIDAATAMIDDAARAGCQMVAFPEVAGMMNRRIAAIRDSITDADRDPFIAACRAAAADHGIWVHTGSTPVISTGAERFRNHATLIGDDGRVVADYDKVHLFDMTPAEGPPIRESNRYAPGQEAVLAATPWGPMGMSICYDVRFPHFYRDYARDGAVAFFVPSAFTVATGRAHWEILLRARAIECGAFVIAAAQVGTHADGRETWGHAMVVDPWGAVLCDMGDTVGVAVVDLDIKAVARARAQIPSLINERSYVRRGPDRGRGAARGRGPARGQ